MPAGNSTKSEEKRVRGRPFEKGKSGNPSGRPKKDPTVTAILTAGGKPAAEYMVELVKDPEAKAADRQRAAEYILDRLLGKATQPIQADVFQAEAPLTLNEMQEIARELIAGDA